MVRKSSSVPSRALLAARIEIQHEVLLVMGVLPGLFVIGTKGASLERGQGVGRCQLQQGQKESAFTLDTVT